MLIAFSYQKQVLSYRLLKIKKRKHIPARTEVGFAIDDLLRGKKLKQADLARILDVSPPIVSQWQSGVRNPTPAQLMKMANLAPDPTYVKFIELAGISFADLKRFIPEMEERFRGYLQRLGEQSGATASIPITKDARALWTFPPDERQIEGRLTIDTSYIPPSAKAVRIQSRQGSWLSYPAKGDIAVLDVDHLIDERNIVDASGRGSLFAVKVERKIAEELSAYRTPAPMLPVFGDRIDPIPDGFYIGPLEHFKLVMEDVLEEVRIWTGRSSWVVAYKARAASDGGDSETPEPSQERGYGQFVLQKGIQFIYPILQLVHPTQGVKK